MAEQVPPVSKGCEVELRGWGYADQKPWNGWIIVNGDIIVEATACKDRGLHVVLMRRNQFWKCDVIANSYRHYDPYQDKNEAEKFGDYIKEQAAGTIILVMAADEVTGRDKGTDAAGTHLEPAKDVLDDLGVTLPGLNFRGSFVFSAVKGTKYHTLRDVKPRGQGPALLKTIL